MQLNLVYLGLRNAFFRKILGTVFRPPDFIVDLIYP